MTSLPVCCQWCGSCSADHLLTQTRCAHLCSFSVAMTHSHTHCASAGNDQLLEHVSWALQWKVGPEMWHWGGRCSRNVLSFRAEAHPHWGELGLRNIMRVFLWFNKLKQIFGVFPPACQLQDAFSVFRPEASVSQQHHCLLLLWITSSHMCWSSANSSWGWVVLSQPWCTHMYTIEQYWQWRANRWKHLEIFLAWISSDPVVSVLAGIE